MKKKSNTWKKSRNLRSTTGTPWKCPWNFAIPLGKPLVFQPSFFRGYTLNLGGVNGTPLFSPLFLVRNHKFYVPQFFALPNLQLFHVVEQRFRTPWFSWAALGCFFDDILRIPFMVLFMGPTPGYMFFWKITNSSMLKGFVSFTKRSTNYTYSLSYPGINLMKSLPISRKRDWTPRPQGSGDPNAWCTDQLITISPQNSQRRLLVFWRVQDGHLLDVYMIYCIQYTYINEVMGPPIDGLIRWVNRDYNS